jgi:hypothetical protein
MSENEVFVYISPVEETFSYTSDLEYLRHFGKWLIYGYKESIEEMGLKMKGLVGKRNILEAKFTKRPATQVPKGYVLGRYHALIVYCDDRKRNKTRKVLEKELGVKEMNWKYDRETWRESLEKGEKIPEGILNALKVLEKR